MTLPVRNSGTAYSADANDNISKIADQIAADGSVVSTQSANASSEQLKLQVVDGVASIVYYNALSTTLSAGSAVQLADFGV